MNLKGICSICGGIANLTCILCGSPVCAKCSRNGICLNCLRGKKLGTPAPRK